MGAGGGGGLDFLSGGGGGGGKGGGGGFDPTGGLFGGGGGGFDPTGGLFSGPGFDPTSLFSGYNNPLSALGMGTGGAYPTTPQVTSTGDVTTQAADPNQQLGTPQNQQQPNVPLPRPDPRTQQPDVPLPRPDPRTPQGPTGFEPLPEGDATKSPAYQTLPGRGPFPGQPGYTPPVATDLPARGPFPGQPGYIPPTMQPLGGSPPYHTHIPLTDPVTGQPTGQNITDEGQYGAPIISAQAPFDPSNPDYQPKFNPAGYTAPTTGGTDPGTGDPTGPSTTGAAPSTAPATDPSTGQPMWPAGTDPGTGDPTSPETTGAAPAAGGPDTTGAGTPPTGAPPGTAAPTGAAPGQQQPDIIHQLLGNSPLGQIVRQFLPMLLGGRGIPGIGGGLPLGMPGYLHGMGPGPGIFNQPFRPTDGGGFPGGGGLPYDHAQGGVPLPRPQPYQPGPTQAFRRPYGGAVNARNQPVDAQGNAIPFMSRNLGSTAGGGTRWQTPDGKIIEQPPRRTTGVARPGTQVAAQPQPAGAPAGSDVGGVTPQGQLQAPSARDVANSRIQGSDTKPTEGFSRVMAQRRSRFGAELQNNPNLRLRIAAMASYEHPEDPIGPVESLMNRADAMNTSLAARITGSGAGFYGPARKGLLEGRMAWLQRNPTELAKYNRAIDSVLHGSNLIAGATDQGSGNDPNVHNPSGKIVRFGETYNDWPVIRGAADWRRRVQAEVQRELGIGRPSWQQGLAF